MSAPTAGQAIAGARAGAQPSLTILEAALWQRLNDSEPVESFVATWLALQCKMIEGASQAVVVACEPAPMRTIATWPEQGPDDSDLMAIVDMAAEQRRPVARGGSGGSLPTVAVPVLAADRMLGVVAIRMSASPGMQIKDKLRAAIRKLQWGCAWLRDRLNSSNVAGPANTLAHAGNGALASNTQAALDMIAAVLEHERFLPAAMATATELAIRYDCARVSIGFVQRGSARVAAISHSAQFGRKMRLVRNIGAAMDEAIDQRSSVLYPVAENDVLAVHAHEALSRVQHDGPVLTIPMFVIDRFIGAFTFERAKEDPFDPKVVALLDVVVAAIAPILDEKRRNDRLLIVKAAESFGEQLKRLFGPNYIGRKLVAAAVAATAIFLSLTTNTYRINADAEIQGDVRRAVVSSYDGYIQDAVVRAGEVVKAGDPLATLEDRELALERLRWATERQQRVFEYDQALATRQPAAINVIKSQIDQADAQIRLLDEQIARTRLVAPFDGLVVSGDLSQRIGTSVSRGEVLFEIATLSDYRVVMQVDERQVAEVAAGQTGEVVFTSLPEESFGFTVEKITPVARPKDGRNVIQVEGHLSQSPERLRPGMTGVAKIAIGEERLVSIWLRPFMNWLRLTTWRWFR